MELNKEACFGVCDEWFVDDGQCFVRPWAFDGATFGAIRGCTAHSNVKRSAQLSAHLSVRTSFCVGTPPYVSQHCHRPQPRLGHHRAGVRLSALVGKSTPAPGSRFVPATRCARPSRALTLLPPIWCSPDSVLTCPSSCTMRINGDVLDHDLLASFDGQLRASVGTYVPDHSWRQATTGAACGGLGLRTATGVVLPAFVASRILSRSLVTTMVDHFLRGLWYKVPRPWLVSSPPSPQRPRKNCLLSSTNPFPSANSCGATCLPEQEMPRMTCLLPLYGTLVASPLMTATGKRSTHLRASARRSRASSLLVCIRAFTRACSRCMKARAAGRLTRGSPSSVVWTWTTPG